MSHFALVEVPAVLVLRGKGFTLTREPGSASDQERWIATKPDLSFDASSPLELLRLVALYEARGTKWQAPSGEIEAFLAKHYSK